MNAEPKSAQNKEPTACGGGGVNEKNMGEKTVHNQKQFPELHKEHSQHKKVSPKPKTT